MESIVATKSSKGMAYSNVQTQAMCKGISFRSRYRKAASAPERRLRNCGLFSSIFSFSVEFQTGNSVCRLGRNRDAVNAHRGGPQAKAGLFARLGKLKLTPHQEGRRICGISFSLSKRAELVPALRAMIRKRFRESGKLVTAPFSGAMLSTG
jgi:hypothetical protein